MKKKLNKKGVSAIIATVILIALVVFIGGLVWVIVNNIVSRGMEEAGSCFGIFDKVKLDPDWTCHNASTNEFHFKIDIGDINVDQVFVGITVKGSSTSFKILKSESQVRGLSMYPDKNPVVRLPDKGGGFTYIADMTLLGFENVIPSSVQISPIIGKQTCEVSSTIVYIDYCR